MGVGHLQAQPAGAARHYGHLAVEVLEHGRQPVTRPEGSYRAGRLTRAKDRGSWAHASGP